jgi:hypothetical protein
MTDKDRTKQLNDLVNDINNKLNNIGVIAQTEKIEADEADLDSLPKDELLKRYRVTLKKLTSITDNVFIGAKLFMEYSTIVSSGLK